MAMARIVQLLTVAYPLAASVSMRKKIAGDAALSIAANGTGTTLLEGDQQAIAALSAELPHRLDDAPMFVLELPTNDLSRTRLKRLREHSPAGTLNNLSFVDGINAASIADKEGLLESSTAQLIFVRQQRDCEVSSLADAVKHTSLMLGEVACWLGHAKVWEIVAEKVPPKSWAIVLEDDVDFTKTARRMLHDLRVRPTSKSRPPLVFLETRQCPYGAGTSEWPSVWSGSAFNPRQWARVLLGHGGYGTQAYAITPETAKVLLQQAAMDEPVDVWMQRPHLPVELICPEALPFIPRRSGTSEIRNRR